MYKVKDLNEAEKKEVGYKSEVELKETIASISKNQKDNERIGTGGILAIVGVVSALAIVGVVVVRKKLNKKVKK